MERRPPNEVHLPISFEVHQRLVDASIRGGFKQEAWEIAECAVHAWLTRHCPDAFPLQISSGYQWKHVFLPNGTLLRTVFDGKNHHCIVEDEWPRLKGRPVTPSGFANAVGGVRRNAWRVVWVLFPNTTVWKLANTLRPKKTGTTSSRKASRADNAVRRTARQPE